MGLGEIRLIAGSYAPEGWAYCNGATLSIQENGDLFKALGTRYGGDGRTNFALPDLRGRAPMHRADGSALGTKGKFGVSAANASPHARLALNFVIAVRPSFILDTRDWFVSEVRPFAFNFAPEGWARCNGAILAISQNTTLFFLLDKTYGGDGTRTFAVPDLSGAYPFQPDNPEQRGQTAGSQVFHDPAHQTPLLTVNYCIAVTGVFPPRGN
jgi:microcystin-dependent protein